MILPGVGEGAHKPKDSSYTAHLLHDNIHLFFLELEQLSEDLLVMSSCFPKSLVSSLRITKCDG